MEKQVRNGNGGIWLLLWWLLLLTFSSLLLLVVVVVLFLVLLKREEDQEDMETGMGAIRLRRATVPVLALVVERGG